MSRRFAVLLVAAVLVASAPAAPVPTHLRKPLVYYYPTTVGTTWVYEDPDGEETLTITKVEDVEEGKVVTVEKVTEKGRTPDEKMIVSVGGLARIESMGSTYSPPMIMLKVPYRPGNTWKSDPARSEENAKVIGVETVKVPAGTFEAVRVDAKYASGVPQPKPASFWYAPGVGLVKFAGSTEQVLKSFTPGAENRR
jgi:hypothetical protein